MMRKGFIFSSMTFLLVIPVVVMAASFINMMEYGGVGAGVVILGDNVYYNGQNIIEYLEDRTRAETKEIAVSDVQDFSEDVGLDLTITQISCNTTRVIIDSGAGVIINRTMTLKNGTLRNNLTLTGGNYTIDDIPVFFREGLLRTSSNITYPPEWGGASYTGAVVSLSFTGLTFPAVQLPAGSGIYRANAPLPNRGMASYYFMDSSTYDWTDMCASKSCEYHCKRKSYLGRQLLESTAVASDTCWYDGIDSHQFRVAGIMYSSTSSLDTPTIGQPFNLTTHLWDDYDDPIANYSWCLNFTTEYPTITINITNYTLGGTVSQSFWYDMGTNITDYDDGSPGGKDLNDGWYIVNQSAPVYTPVKWTYVMCTSWPDYINTSGDTIHCEYGQLFPVDLSPIDIDYRTSGATAHTDNLINGTNTLRCGTGNNPSGKALHAKIINDGEGGVSEYGLELKYFNGTWNTYWSGAVTDSNCIPTPGTHVWVGHYDASTFGNIAGNVAMANITYTIPTEDIEFNNTYLEAIP